MRRAFFLGEYIINYLELVNEALDQAGVDLDGLTEANFANPTPTKMYKRFKKWVADAWHDLQLNHTDWGLTVSRGSVMIYPRLVVKYVNGIIQIGESVYDSDNNLVGTIVATSPCPGGLTFVDLDQIEEVPLLGEMLTTTSATVFTFVHQGQYSMYEFASDLDDINFNSVFVTNDTSTQQRLQYIPWSAYSNYNHTAYPTSYLNSPYCYTINAQHMIEVMPPLSVPVVISFSYIKTAYKLVEWYDVPSQLPGRFHDLIVWMAVSKYCDYDNNTTLWSKADKNVHSTFTKADSALGTQITIGGWNE